MKRSALKGSGPIQRKSWMPRATKPIRKRKRRTAAEVREKFEREYGSDERVKWIRDFGCLVCGAVPCDNAHTENDGASRKGPARSIVPLCRAHHRESHHGVETFEAKYSRQLVGRTLVSWAATFAHAWEKRSGEVAA